MHTVLLVIHVMVAIALIGVIAVQRSASQGFGTGAGIGSSVFSSRGKADFITKLTGWLAAGFFVTSLTLAYMGSEGSRHSLIDRIGEQPASEAPASAETAPAEPSVPLAK